MPTKSIKQFLLPSFLVTLLALLPFLLKKEILLDRNNDLTEFFWPLFYYIKQSILETHKIPFTNDVFFAGTPLISDPQNPLWYPFNILFLFLKIDTAIIFLISFHIFLASLGANIMSRKVFKFSIKTSFIITFLYVFSSQLFSFLEAGHWGLIICWSWIPYLIISSYFLSKKIEMKTLLIFSFSAFSIYVSHILTFGICYLFVVLFFVYKKSFKSLVTGTICTLVLISVPLYFQLTWSAETTRNLLIKFPETFPIWRGKREFIKTLFIFNPQTEKAITIGFFSALISFYGFLKLKTNYKILFLTTFVIFALIVTNNVSPIFHLLTKFNLFLLLRVSTRIWFVFFLVILYITGFGLEKLNKKIFIIFLPIIMIESIFNSYSYFKKPINELPKLPPEIFKLIENKKENFRVLCINHCISQKEAAIHNIKLVDGYGTLQNLSFYYELQDALNTTWTGYSLVLPPFDTQNKNIQPNAKLLLNFNTKFLITKNVLNDPHFQLVKNANEYYLYKNRLWN